MECLIHFRYARDKSKSLDKRISFAIKIRVDHEAQFTDHFVGMILFRPNLLKRNNYFNNSLLQCCLIRKAMQKSF